MILIKNGQVHVGNGEVLENTDILIKDNTIIKVEKNIEEDNCTEIIDANGKVIFPGFIDTLTCWGAYGPSWYDDDLHEGSDCMVPDMESIYACDHDAVNFQEVYKYGITSFGFAPSIYNIMGGKISSFKTYGNSPYNMLLSKECGIMASVSSSAKNKEGKVNPMTRMGVFAKLKQALYDAQNYKESDKYDGKNKVLKNVLNKEIPLFINCTSKLDIESTNALLEEFDIDIILTGAFEVSESVSKVKKIVLGNMTGGMILNSRNLDYSYINGLLKDNELVCIGTCGDNSAQGKETLLWNTMLHYRNGIKSEDILKMITLNPAKILGIDSKVGSIEIGKDADIVVWSKNPIETFQANILNCFISGKDVSKLGGRTSCW